MFLTAIIGLFDLLLGAMCKSEFMYNFAFLISGCGYLQMFLSLTRAHTVCNIAVATVFLAGFAYCFNMRTEYGSYCADYGLIAAQLLLLTVFALLAVKREGKAENSEQEFKVENTNSL